MLRGINVDPSAGSSWQDRGIPGDNQYSFSITGAISPIVFIVGKGVSTGFQLSGNTKTFLYACADANTKYYCFDLMRDDGVGGPGLKTRDVNGNITFNSRQPALNIVRSIQAPPPGPLDGYGRPVVTYQGGRNERIQWQSSSGEAIVHSVVDIPLDSDIEYAVFLPWNRGCGIISTYLSNFSGSDLWGVSEGAYGRTGGISFMFGPPGRQTQQSWTQTSQVNISYNSLPNLRPNALVIKTSGLPFPFN